jgi:hypothetical protein
MFTLESNWLKTETVWVTLRINFQRAIIVGGNMAKNERYRMEENLINYRRRRHYRYYDKRMGLTLRQRGVICLALLLAIIGS